MKTEEIRELVEAQMAHCRRIKAPIFIPKDGKCWRCGNNIFEDATMESFTFTGEQYLSKGYSKIKASTELITGCPHCHWSFCD